MAINITKMTGTANTTASAGRSIKYIVEHYTAGVNSKSGAAANTASWFGQTAAQASADFIVDDENIVQYNPDPANRYCWAVGGNSYGNKGGSLYGIAKNANVISIEICSTNSTGKVTDANDKYWSFSDAVLAKAKELTLYLMEKYGIDADHVIRHYDVNGKPCPGIIGWNADSGDDSAWKAFKASLTGETVEPAAEDDGSMTDAEMWAYFKAEGLTDCGAAGLMGNLYAESALYSNNLQNTGNTKLGMSDEEYTAAVDSGSYKNFVDDGYGYGLAQWTFWSRKQALLDHMAAEGCSIGNKRQQLVFLMKELASDFPTVLAALQSAASVTEASNVVLLQFEKPADQSESVQATRAGYSQTYYDKYADIQAADTGSGTGYPATPFTVKVIIDDLRIRSTPDGDPTGQYTGKGTFTIVEVSGNWGKLKSGAGWICIGNSSYVTIGASEEAPVSGDLPYQVRVTSNCLRIRENPGTDSKWTGEYTGVGTFTITEEADGIGASKWGHLKSGAGWISLDYATKV